MIIHLVRHGQAAFGTDDYDRLTELGIQQSRWLGEYFAERGTRFARIVTGNLRRQQQTTSALLEAHTAAVPLLDGGLDEYRVAEILGAHGFTGSHSDPRAYYRGLRGALLAWTAGSLDNAVPESWPVFGARIERALRACVSGLPREAEVLLVTSGGVIARAVADALGAAPAIAVELNLQARNTGVTELIAGSRGLRLSSFNAVPHLERPERRSAITYT